MGRPTVLNPMRVAGSFDPPTVADLAAIARQDVRTVAVAVRPSDTFAPHVRVRWLRELLPGVPVDVWDEAAGQGGVLRLPPHAGEAVKADPMGRWDEIPAPVRPAFVRRIRLFGAESSGKSTMAAHLAERFETVWVPEMSRPLYEARGYHFDYDDVQAVVTAQLEAEETAARDARRVLVCDTDVLTTLLYSRHYFGRAPAFLGAFCDAPGYARRYAATLLFAPDLPWTPDPVRDSPEARAYLFGLFRGELDLRRVAYTLVSGAGRARERIAEAAVEAVWSASDGGGRNPPGDLS